MKALFVTWENVIGSTYYHCFLPALKLQRDYGVTVDMSTYPKFGYDLVYFFRKFDEQTTSQARELQKAGSKVWVGMDDAYWVFRLGLDKEVYDEIYKVADKAIVTNYFFKECVEKRVDRKVDVLRGSVSDRVVKFKTLPLGGANIEELVNRERDYPEVKELKKKILFPGTPQHNVMLPKAIKPMFTEEKPLYSAWKIMEHDMPGNFGFAVAPPSNSDMIEYWKCKCPLKWWEIVTFGGCPVLPYNKDYGVFQEAVDLTMGNIITYDINDAERTAEVINGLADLEEQEIFDFIEVSICALFEDSKRLDEFCEAV